MKKFTSTAIALLLTAFVWPTVASAQSLDARIAMASRINSANAMVRDGKLDEAIDAYQQIQPAGSDRDMLDYNLGVAQFCSGDLAEAKEAFTAVAASPDAQLASSSRYNLGNCLYSEAIQQAEQDKAAAIQSLREAIAHYRGALRGNPDNAVQNADARANIELANELIRKLEEEQQQEEQPQNQQEQNQDQQQQQDQSSDQQDSDQQDSQSQQSAGEQSEDSESESGTSENGEEQSNPESSESQEHGEESDELEQSQSNNSQQQDDESEQQSESDSSPESQSEQSQDQSEQQSSDQQQSSNERQTADRSQANQQQAGGGDPSADEESDMPQEIPAGELSAGGEQENEDGEPRGAVMGDPNAEDGLMSKEEALKMLQAVRDRDMLRRLRQQQAERSRHVPVDRDW